MPQYRAFWLLFALSAWTGPVSAQLGPVPGVPAASVGQPGGPAKLDPAGDLAVAGRLTVTTHLTGTLADAAVNVALTAAGSGVNGPTTAQNGQVINAVKDNWYGATAAVGELDGLTINLRQGGPGSDSAGILLNVQNTGTGFETLLEGHSSIVDPTTGLLTYDMDVADGILNGMGKQYLGRAYTAYTGQMTAAELFQNNPGSHWGNFIMGYKDGSLVLTITDTGKLTSTDTVSAAGFTASGPVTAASVSSAGPVSAPGGSFLGSDAANGSLVLGYAAKTATPYIDLLGVSGMRLLGDAAGKLTISNPSLGGVVSFQSASGGNSMFMNGSASFSGVVSAPSFAATASHTPASSSEACTAGQEAWDTNYEYRCVAANQWRRVALSSF